MLFILKRIIFVLQYIKLNIKVVTEKLDLKNLHFPQYFPKNCPPKDAEEKEMTVYRFCRNKHIVEDDFKSYYQKDPNK